jgi:hypothetical protein
VTDQIPPRKVFAAISNVTAALAKVGIAKSQRNKDQGYSFRGIDQVYNALAPLLAQYKLVILPKVLSREVREHTFNKGGKGSAVALTVEYQFVSAEDNSCISVVSVGEGLDSSDKATNKAFSAAYKYAVMQAFAIPIEGTPDADSETPESESAPVHDGPSPVGETGTQAGFTAADLERVKQRLRAAKMSEAKTIRYFEVQSLDQLSPAQAKELNDWLTEKEKGNADQGTRA